MTKLADKIKAYRKKNNLSQTELANRLHVTKQAVSKWETKRGYPDSSIIPEIAKELNISIDSLMGDKRTHKKLIVSLSIIATISILLIIIIPIIINNINEQKEYDEFIQNIETTLNIDLPNKGELITVDFEDWLQFGNSISVTKMSYVVFKDNNELSIFEENLDNSDIWLNNIDYPLLPLIPLNIQGYTTSGDYFILYNNANSSINASLDIPGLYNYLYLIYQKDNNRLIIFEYPVNIEEGE